MSTTDSAHRASTEDARTVRTEPELALPKNRDNSKAAAVALALLVFGLASWQWAVSTKLTSELVLPAPLGVAESLQNGLFAQNGSWWADIWATLKSTLVGFAIGTVLALVVGTLLAYVQVLRLAIYPYVIFFQTFPKIAIAPLLVAWLGYGIWPKIVIGALLAFFPVFSNTVTGMSQVDADEIRLMRSLGAGRLQELRFLRLPNSMPYIFAAMDVAMVVSLLGVIVGEFVGSSEGLGFRIQDRTAFGDTASVYAVLLILGLMGTLLHVIMVRVKRAVVYRE